MGNASEKFFFPQKSADFGFPTAGELRTTANLNGEYRMRIPLHEPVQEDVLNGVTFDPETGQIADWQIVKIETGN